MIPNTISKLIFIKKKLPLGKKINLWYDCMYPLLVFYILLLLLVIFPANTLNPINQIIYSIGPTLYRVSMELLVHFP